MEPEEKAIQYCKSIGLDQGAWQKRFNISQERILNLSMAGHGLKKCMVQNPSALRSHTSADGDRVVSGL